MDDATPPPEVVAGHVARNRMWGPGVWVVVVLLVLVGAGAILRPLCRAGDHAANPA